MKEEAQHMIIPSFNIGGAFSFASWINYDKFNNFRRIIGFNATNNHNLILANVGGGTQIGFEIRIAEITNFTSRQFRAVDQWVHVWLR